MALFGGSKSSSKNESIQLGAETGGGDAAVINASGGSTVSYVNQFPDAVASFASNILGFTQDVISQGQSQSEAVLDTLGTIAVREKTPLTEWLPFAAVAAAGIVALAFFNR